MSNTAKIRTYKTMSNLVTHLRDDFNSGGNDFLLLYAYNGTGKTRLSMEFKKKGKRGGGRDTLYFNAFTEDLFRWDNDLVSDSLRVLTLNSDSKFFAAFSELALEEKIFIHLEKYADFDFRIDYVKWTVTFKRGAQDHIKVSRGEENLFIWCTFLAICELAIDRQEAYDWVKYIYIDDPISSLDDNNAIAVASDLAALLHTGKDKVKVLISTHHGLFFNIMCNELKKYSHKSYFLYRNKQTDHYKLQATGDTPFFYHVAMLKELKDASDSGNLYTYHFNILRSIMEKTSSFFGAEDFSKCISENIRLNTRALNVLSHGKYSIYEPREMLPDNKMLFAQILADFLGKYPFELPNLESVAAPIVATPLPTTSTLSAP